MIFRTQNKNRQLISFKYIWAQVRSFKRSPNTSSETLGQQCVSNQFWESHGTNIDTTKRFNKKELLPEKQIMNGKFTSFTIYSHMSWQKSEHEYYVDYHQLGFPTDGYCLRGCPSKIKSMPLRVFLKIYLVFATIWISMRHTVNCNYSDVLLLQIDTNIWSLFHYYSSNGLCILFLSNPI